jgi:hypothetical protein
MGSPTTWAFVTPSYVGDLERCRLLSRSMDSFLSGPWHHYIVVDQPDWGLFKEFAGPRRTVLLTHDIVPKGLHHLFNVPFAQGRSLWWSRSTGLMVGWHLQQFVKIGMAAQVADEGLAYCDSDMFFLKPFDVAALTRGKGLRMYRSFEPLALSSLSNPKYTENALTILGLPREPRPYYDYVDNFITWHRPTVLEMCRHIEAKSGRSWHGALGRKLKISEYALYGNFVDGVQKSVTHVYADPHSLCRTQWDRSNKSDEDVRAFCAGLNPQQVAVGIQSFAGVDVKLLKSIFDAAASGNAKANPRQKALA